MHDTRLTVAEGLIIDVLVLATMNGAGTWTFDRDGMWITPQLDSLADKGLLTWAWDEESNFLVTPTAELAAHEAAVRVRNKINNSKDRYEATSTRSAL